MSNPADRYELQSVLGQGGFANVWRAYDKKLQRYVAIKVLEPGAENTSSVLDHATALTKVNHPNVVTVHTVDPVIDPETGAVVEGIVMELVDGEPLADVLKAPFSRLRAQEIGISIIEGLEAIHSVGAVHSDLHDENILISKEKIKIIDILYRYSLAQLRTSLQKGKFQRDVVELYSLLYSILAAADCEKKALVECQSDSKSTLSEIKKAFIACTQLSQPETNRRGRGVLHRIVLGFTGILLSCCGFWVTLAAVYDWPLLDVRSQRTDDETHLPASATTGRETAPTPSPPAELPKKDVASKIPSQPQISKQPEKTKRALSDEDMRKITKLAKLVKRPLKGMIDASHFSKEGGILAHDFADALNLAGWKVEATIALRKRPEAGIKMGFKEYPPPKEIADVFEAFAKAIGRKIQASRLGDEGFDFGVFIGVDEK